MGKNERNGRRSRTERRESRLRGGDSRDEDTSEELREDKHDQPAALGKNDEQPAESSSKKTCFVICPIGETGSSTRRRTDQLLKYIVSPVAESLGYQVDRSDRIADPGLITSQIIQHVLNDDLVIADLTERNPNVFYELAIRHIIRKPLVQMIGDYETLPFDVANMRTIRFDHRDLDSVEQAKTELRRQIERVADNFEIETPISAAIDVAELHRTDDPDKRVLADVLGALANLQSELIEIRKRLPAHPVGPAITYAAATAPVQAERNPQQRDQPQGLSAIAHLAPAVPE